jgi:hypothetical protein
MSTNFDWKTEEEFDWENSSEENPPPKKSPGKRKTWLAIIAIILLIGGLSAALYYQLDQRIDENREAMQSDVISSYNLLRLAEIEQDDELFFSLLSGRDDKWTAAQHKLFQSQSLRDRTPLGIRVQQAESMPIEPDKPTITFSPDMLTAEVSMALPYEIQIGNGLTETVTLQETSLYRLGQERWLLSPPDEPFWGAPLSAEGGHIILDYRMRDEEVATQLLVDLERKYEELCSQLEDIVCDPSLRLNISLSTDPQTLVDSAFPHAGLLTNNGLRINLPSPTLVGFPQDEAGYQALYRGYAARMATAVLSQQSGYECCKQMVFQQALIDYQLNQLALKPWPINEEDYGQVLNEQIRLEDYSTLWQSDDPQDLFAPNGWRIYILIDYLLSALPNHSPMALQQELARRGSFAGWLNGLFEDESRLKNAALMSELTRDLWMRGYQQTLNTSEGVVQSHPSQDLYLPCSSVLSGGSGGRVSNLFQFDFEANTWGNIFETSSSLWTASLPGDDILVQQEYNDQILYWAGKLLRKDQPLTPIGKDGALTISFAQTDPLTTGLIAYVFDTDSDEPTITWFDLQNCNESEGCTARVLPGIPTWSPNGEQALFTGSQFNLLNKELQTIMLDRGTNSFDYPIYIGERSQLLEGEPPTRLDELSVVGRGHAPFWIDNDLIGYVAGDGDPIIRQSSRVMVTTVDQNTPQLLFTLEEIVEGIEESLDVTRFYWIHYVMVHPDNPNQLFVVVLSTHNRRAHVLSFDRTTKAVKQLMSTGFRANHSLGISPDGRYLVLTGVNEEDPDPEALSTSMQVYDLERGEITPFLIPTSDYPPFPPYDWSLDGQWLAVMLGKGTVGLFGPDQKLLQLLKPPPGECTTPVWMNS